MSATQATFTAIKARYSSSAGDAIRTAGCTGLYLGRAPQSAVYPFIVFNTPATLSEPTVGQGTSSGAIYDDLDIDIGVYTDKRSPNIGYTILNAWDAAFNFVTLTMASPYKQIDGHRKTAAMAIEEPDQKGWHVVETFVYNVGN